MDKHAYMIMAHNHVAVLKKIIHLLDDPRNDIYLHWDAKSPPLDEDDIRSVARQSQIIFVSRLSVHWAGYSQTKCMVHLLKCATQQKEYACYHLLSGADLPLKTQDEIHQFFAQHAGHEFIYYESNPEQFAKRMQYYYFFQDIYGRNRRNLIYVGLYILDGILLRLQQLIGVNRLRDEKMEIKKGAQWFSITHDCALYLLSQEEWIQRRCRYTRYSDEVFVQTLVWYSPFREKLFSKPDVPGLAPSLRLIDWNRGLPYTFTSNEYEELMQSPNLFARKFSPDTDPAIIDHIYDTLCARLALAAEGDAS